METFQFAYYVVIDSYIRIVVALNVEFSYMRLKGKKIINSTSLFIGEGKKLLKYINRRFDFIFTSTLKFKLNQNVEVFKTDYFFKNQHM